MTDEEFKELWYNDEMESVDVYMNDSWRHGVNITEIFKYTNGEEITYWECIYRKSGDGEWHGIREMEFNLRQVTPITQTIVTTKYVPV